MLLSELRIDPVVGRKVLIAENRINRPSDYCSTGDFVDSPAAEGAEDCCPFCAGNEHLTLKPLDQTCDENGLWRVRVVPNKFPAVSYDSVREEPSGVQSPLFASDPAFGSHEVIVESPRHIRDITELSIEELAQVLLVYRDRLRHWSKAERIRQVLVFKNAGFAAGASLEHVHSQLIALPFVPDVIANEMRGAEQFYDRAGECVFCRLLREEIEQTERLVAEDGPFVAFCAYAGRQPFETWILPKSHAPNFETLTDADALPLARLLQQLLCRLRTHLKPLSYNLILHSVSYGEQDTEHYHWHLEIIPRTAQLAGLEWGAGVYVNSLPPERAAKLLREAHV